MYLGFFSNVLNQELLSKTNAETKFSESRIKKFEKVFNDFRPYLSIISMLDGVDGTYFVEPLRYLKEEMITLKSDEIEYQIGEFNNTFYMAFKTDYVCYEIKSSKSCVELVKMIGDEIVSDLFLNSDGHCYKFGNSFELKDQQEQSLE